MVNEETNSQLAEEKVEAAEEKTEEEGVSTELAVEETSDDDQIETVLGATSDGTVLVNEGSRANVRSEPNIKSRIIDQLKRRHQVVILDEDVSWVKVEFVVDEEVKEGWIFKSLVEY